ncbi:double-CXXCG motif protein [Myxococcus sp. CA039A]|uniref:double-CXXCG motif protein n=1 Tax=Myxococcus sp. CA039A TaxID=2741737 RepID=UPI00157A41CF|nr:hypothetical protein [Myxococcus sp. CA039A]
MREDRSETTFDGEFEAAHKWGLPGLSCPACGATWRRLGSQLPLCRPVTTA